MMTKNWYVVHAHSGFEEKVATLIREQAQAKGLETLIEEVLVPAEDVVDVRKGKRVSSERKFFPGYLLVKMELTDATQNLVKNTPKVSGFLGNDKKPVHISEQEAQEMLKKISDGLQSPRQSITFQIGEQVRVCEGPFASFNGYVEEVDNEKARLKVSVSIFGRATPVDLDYGQVEKF